MSTKTVTYRDINAVFHAAVNLPPGESGSYPLLKPWKIRNLDATKAHLVGRLAKQWPGDHPQVVFMYGQLAKRPGSFLTGYVRGTLEYRPCTVVVSRLSEDTMVVGCA